MGTTRSSRPGRARAGGPGGRAGRKPVIRSNGAARTTKSAATSSPSRSRRPVRWPSGSVSTVRTPVVRRTSTPCSASQLQPRPVDLAQGGGGDLHPVAVAVAEEAVEEDLPGVADVHPVEPLVERRDQDGAPVAVDGPVGLAVPAEPALHRLARPVPARGPEPGQAVGDPDPLGPGQVIGPEEAPGEMEGRGPGAGLELRDVSPRGSGRRPSAPGGRGRASRPSGRTRSGWCSRPC